VKLAFRLILLAIVVALGAWLWTVLFPSPEKVIGKRLAAVAHDVSFGANENPLAIASKAGTLAELFTTNVQVTLEASGGDRSFDGRDELMQAAAGAHAAVSSLAVQFMDITITVAPDRQSATASVVVHVRVGGEKDDFLQPLKFSFQKSGRDWLIRKVETLHTLT